jgi:hypothetical protein
MRKFVASFVLVVCVSVICGTTYAHHGLAGAYDNTLRITVQATVTGVTWANPHAQLFFDLTNDKGEVEHWGMEQLSPGNLVRIGWYKTTFKPGDIILVSFVPAKADRHFAGCGHIVMADGTKFITGQCGVEGGPSKLAWLPIKDGYKAVEVKFPEFPNTDGATFGTGGRGPRQGLTDGRTQQQQQQEQH